MDGRNIKQLRCVIVKQENNEEIIIALNGKGVKQTMSRKTINKGITVPQLSDPPNIEVVSSAFDEVDGHLNDLDSRLAAKAPLNSPAFTGDLNVNGRIIENGQRVFSPNNPPGLIWAGNQFDTFTIPMGEGRVFIPMLENARQLSYTAHNGVQHTAHGCIAVRFGAGIRITDFSGNTSFVAQQNPSITNPGGTMYVYRL